MVQTQTPTAIPDSHRDLLDEPYHGILTTMMPDGQPQCTLVWCDTDGEAARVNTTRERQKGRNLMAYPRATLLIVDPADSSRWIEIRGRVELIEEGAVEHLDALTRQYTRHPCYYGFVYPEEQRDRETRIICWIIPHRINCDAIHK